MAVTFDQRPELEYKARKFYRRMRDMHGWRCAKNLGGFGFERRQNFAPLQAADLIAFEGFKLLFNYCTSPHRDVRIPMKRLSETGRLQGIYWDENKLASLRNYIDKHHRGDLRIYFAEDLARDTEDQFLTLLKQDRLNDLWR